MTAGAKSQTAAVAAAHEKPRSGLRGFRHRARRRPEFAGPIGATHFFFRLLSHDSPSRASFFSLITGHEGALLGVQRREVLPLVGQVVLVEDRLDRALRDAGLAVDALVRVDVEHLGPFVEAIDRADDHAVGVLAVEAGLGDDVSHS